MEVTFIADRKTAHVDSLTASPAAGIIADNTDFSILTAVVTDAKGNPVEGEQVLFNGGDVSWRDGHYKSNANGIATTKIVSSLAGKKLLKASAKTQLTGFKYTEATFVAAPISASNSILQLSNTSILPADGKSTLTITLTAKDQYGNNITGAKFSFKASNFDGAKMSAVTEKNGIYTATLTSGTKAGSGNITVWQNDKQVKDISTDVGQYLSKFTLMNN